MSFPGRKGGTLVEGKVKPYTYHGELDQPSTYKSRPEEKNVRIPVRLATDWEPMRKGDAINDAFQLFSQRESLFQVGFVHLHCVILILFNLYLIEVCEPRS